MIRLHPLFLPEQNEADHHDEDGDDQDRRIAPAPFQLRHVAEVHAVPPGDQGQGHEDGGDDRQHSHDPVLPLIQMRLDHVPQLGHVFPLPGDGILQADHPLGEHMEIAQVFIPEEAVLVFLQFLGQVDELFIVNAQVQQIAPDVVHLCGIAVHFAPKDGLLQLIQLVLRLLQQRQVLPDGGFQQVVQEALQAGEPPFLRATDGLHQPFGIAAAVHQDDSLLVQGEGERVARPVDPRAVGNAEGPGERILVDHRLRLVGRGGFHVHVDEHIEAFPALLPLLRGQHRDVLCATGGDVLRFAGSQGFPDQIIHDDHTFRISTGARAGTPGLRVWGSIISEPTGLVKETPLPAAQQMIHVRFHVCTKFNFRDFLPTGITGYSQLELHRKIPSFFTLNILKNPTFLCQSR